MDLARGHLVEDLQHVDGHLRWLVLNVDELLEHSKVAGQPQSHLRGICYSQNLIERELLLANSSTSAPTVLSPVFEQKPSFSLGRFVCAPV